MCFNWGFWFKGNISKVNALALQVMGNISIAHASFEANNWEVHRLYVSRHSKNILHTKTSV